MTPPGADASLDRLAHPPLQVALVQVRTSPMLAAEEAATVRELLGSLPDWSVIDRQQAIEAQLVLGPNGISQQGGEPRTVWVLATGQNSIRAQLSENTLAVEANAYESWEIMRAALSDLLGAVSDRLKPARCQRLGVRYINVLPAPTRASVEHLSELVCAPLLETLVDLEMPVRSSMSELRVADGDHQPERVVVLRHGLQPEGGYVLDFDAYVEFDGAVFEAAMLSDLAGQLHDRIESLFVWSLAEPALARLKAGEQLA